MTGGKAGGGYLDSLSMFGIKPGLEATAELMRRVGNPEKELAFLHIAGTNGKGSTGAMLECMLRGAGFTTGFYTSPHLVDIRERFRVNGIAVSEEDYAAFSAELAAAARAETGRDFTFTYFEFTTVLAAMIFARAGVDVVVWAAGSIPRTWSVRSRRSSRTSRSTIRLTSATPSKRSRRKRPGS